VNRSLATDISANIRLHDFAVSETAAVHTLSARSLTEANDELLPTRVKPVDSVEAAHPDGWIHIFPHSSVTVIALHRK